MQLLELYNAAASEAEAEGAGPAGGNPAAAQAAWVVKAAESAALVLRALFAQPALVDELVEVGAVGALARVIPLGGGRRGADGRGGRHAHESKTLSTLSLHIEPSLLEHYIASSDVASLF